MEPTFHEIRQDRDISPSVHPSTSAKTGLLVFTLGVLVGLSASDIGVFRHEPPLETFRTTSTEFSPPSSAQASTVLSAVAIADAAPGLASDNAMAVLTKSVVRVSSDVAAGSGVIIDEAGGVLTSAHVVKGSPRVSVDVGHGEWLEGVVTYVDEELDLAFLTLPPGRYPAVELGHAGDLNLGMPLTVAGYPLNLPGWASVTKGIVSRLFTDDEGRRMIQTDAAVNLGNSGGPVFSEDGRLVGIISSIVGEYQSLRIDGIAYAISIDTIRLRFLDAM
ncbi:MAG: trypsin-like peptidase domain-containing protein [Chloroflexi bacterium]|nr:trypsin-like peptidase domain-containing protein [Chloroflexota bacterium]